MWVANRGEKAMISAESPRITPIVECLSQHLSAVERTGPDRWQFRVSGGADTAGTIVMQPDWLRIGVRLIVDRTGRLLSPRQLQWMLQANAELPGGVKFWLDEPGQQASLAAEIPLEDDNFDSQRSLEPWIGEVCAGLRQGALLWSVLKARNPGRHETAMIDLEAEVDGEAEHHLAQLCQRIGWTFSTRANRQIAVRLDVRDAFCQALLAPDLGQMSRLRVSLGQATASDGDSPEAISMLLLSACRAVRLARAVVAPASETLEYRWEVLLPPGFGGRELKHALSALSVACQLTARELQSLEDETIAREYLAMRERR
jgi:hypothetical protein